MRRSERKVSELSEILSILNKCEVMRLGLCEGNKPYIVPMNFAFEREGDKLRIYVHCAKEGKKIDIIKRNNNVCFEADCSYKTVEAEKACSWSAEYESVIGEGTISFVSDAAQKIAALDLLMKRYGFEGKPSYEERAAEAVTVLRIDVQSITGKRNIKQ